MHTFLGKTRLAFLLALSACIGRTSAYCQSHSEVTLPAGVRAVWDLEKAFRETTSTRERICLNGLWRWQPSLASRESVPDTNWGFFKVPGCWPGIADYMQKDFQTVYAHSSWKNQDLRNLTTAWYQREITVPKDWTGRQIALTVEYLNSLATVFVDKQKAGDIRFPAGEVDLTPFVQPGGKHVVSIFTAAVPLKAVMLAFNDTAAAQAVKGSVPRRGLCGDVFLVSSPQQANITNVKVDPSVRHWSIAIHADLTKLIPGTTYKLQASIGEHGHAERRFTSQAFQGNDLKDGRFTFVETWQPAKLWDVHTPQNQYDLELSLLDQNDRIVDVFFPVRFGFRELWVDGPDIKLNGTRIFWSGVPLDNAEIGAATATYEAARESLQRLQSIGINMVYTHNYGCTPGSHLGFEEILRAADDAGMLIALSQPHFGHYEWKTPDAEHTNGYAQHAAFYVRLAQNHPSVIAYATSHNETGYAEMMNPDLIDGVADPRDQWSRNGATKALRAEAILHDLDPSRIVYHHSGGNLGAIYTSNFYLNMVPIQERSDWFEHWATKSAKPLFLCEYGMPYFLNWTMYRGWYKGERAWGSAAVPYEFCLAEWDAQWLGDRAFQITEREKKNLRWEARKFRAREVWHHWDYPSNLYSPGFEAQHEVLSQYTANNWRAFRTWGVSGTSPWNFDWFWKLRDGVDKGRKNIQVDWDNLQRPGFSPDFVDQQLERMDLAFDRSDWIPTVAGEALLHNNQPLLAFLGGKPGAFTEKGHNFHSSETVEKQLVIVNNCRETVECECAWSLETPAAQSGNAKLVVPTGEIQMLRLKFALPPTLKPGAYKLSLEVNFGARGTQHDSFVIHVLPTLTVPKVGAKLAIFDPPGDTIKNLKALGMGGDVVQADADFSKYQVLIVGKRAITADGPALDLSGVRDGLKVIVFEQTSDVLERRFGFRVQEYGLRNVFKRVPDDPLLAGLEDEHLRDWRGEATILPARLAYEMRPQYGPTITNSGIKVTRPWRCGSRGNVASVLIEKPARGDFLAVVDGGFSLQYSPLLEYREGRGMLVFCQMDVTARTEADPAAERLTRNLVEYVTAWKPAPRRTILYAGEPAGRKHLEDAGFSVEPYTRDSLKPDCVLVVTPGGGDGLRPDKDANAAWLKQGGHVLAVGLEAAEAQAFLAVDVETTNAEHIAAYFDAPDSASAFAGIGSADVHNRDPREIPLVTRGAQMVGDGVLAVTEDGHIVFCQLVPWQFNPGQQNTKRTFRRTSCLLSRLLGNLGVQSQTPLLSRFLDPVKFVQGSPIEPRWLRGLYLEQPEEWDDPYRFFGW